MPPVLLPKKLSERAAALRMASAVLSLRDGAATELVPRVRLTATVAVSTVVGKLVGM